MSNKQIYHGWVITLSPESTGYSFQCCLSEKNIALSDGKIYPTSQQALRSAWLRADLEAVKLCLSAFLHGRLQRLLLSNAELTALENSITQVVESACNR